MNPLDRLYRYEIEMVNQRPRVFVGDTILLRARIWNEYSGALLSPDDAEAISANVYYATNDPFFTDDWTLLLEDYPVFLTALVDTQDDEKDDCSFVYNFQWAPDAPFLLNLGTYYYQITIQLTTGGTVIFTYPVSIK